MAHSPFQARNDRSEFDRLRNDLISFNIKSNLRDVDSLSKEWLQRILAYISLL